MTGQVEAPPQPSREELAARRVFRKLDSRGSGMLAQQDIDEALETMGLGDPQLRRQQSAALSKFLAAVPAVHRACGAQCPGITRGRCMHACQQTPIPLSEFLPVRCKRMGW